MKSENMSANVEYTSPVLLETKSLRKYFTGKNPLAEYVAGYAIQDVEEWAAGLAWAKVIWDVTAVAWLLNDDQRFMNDRLVSCPEIAGDSKDAWRISGASCFEETDRLDPMRYVFSKERHTMRYVYRIERDALMTDLIRKLYL